MRKAYVVHYSFLNRAITILLFLFIAASAYRRMLALSIYLKAGILP